jgi:hypothetical protein
VSTRSKNSTLLFGRHKSSFLTPKRASGVVRDEIYGPNHKKKLLQNLCIIVWQKHITKLFASRYKLSKIQVEKRQNTGKMDPKKCQKRVPPQDQIFDLEIGICLWFEHFGDGKVLFLIKFVFSIKFLFFNIFYYTYEWSVFIICFVFFRISSQNHFFKTFILSKSELKTQKSQNTNWRTRQKKSFSVLFCQLVLSAWLRGKFYKLTQFLIVCIFYQYGNSFWIKCVNVFVVKSDQNSIGIQKV